MRTTCTTYDSEGRVSQVTPTTGSATTYTYDAEGRTRTATEGSLVVRTDYDERGNAAFTRDASGAEAAFRFDADGRLTRRAATTGALGGTEYVQTYAYDVAGSSGPAWLRCRRQGEARPPHVRDVDVGLDGRGCRRVFSEQAHDDREVGPSRISGECFRWSSSRQPLRGPSLAGVVTRCEVRSPFSQLLHLGLPLRSPSTDAST